MLKITFIDVEGREHVATAREGENLMEIAQSHLVPGILGDCGGCANCGTCHGYIDPQWQELAGPAGEEEHLLLDGTDHIQPNSRLTCQVRMTQALDGLIVRLPPSQR